jgi:hypothetical protein
LAKVATEAMVKRAAKKFIVRLVNKNNMFMFCNELKKSVNLFYLCAVSKGLVNTNLVKKIPIYFNF